MPPPITLHLISLDHTLLDLNKKSDTRERFGDLTKHRLNLIIFVITNQKFFTLSKNHLTIIPVYHPYKSLAYLKLIFSLRRYSPPDLIVTNDPILGFFSKIARPCIPLQISVFGSRLLNWRWLFERPHHLVLWFIELVTLFLARTIRTDTSLDRTLLHQWLRLPLSKIITIPVLPYQSTLKLFSKQPRIPSPKPSVLTISALTPNKDLPNLFRAAAKVVAEIPEVSFTLIGAGPLETPLLKLRHQLHLDHHLILMGNLDYADLPSWYAQSWVYVCPSIQEGLPRVLIEAVVSRCPVITTSIPGAYDLLNHNVTGTIVPRQNHKKLAQAIIWHLHHPQASQHMANQAKIHTKNYLQYNYQMSRLINSWYATIDNKNLIDL